METGTVKFFNEEKGFGFIHQDGTEKDVFVHKTGVREYIRENDKVQFVLGHGDKGPFAQDVEVI